jgi:integrase
MRSSPLLHSWLATAAARWTRTATISVDSSSGQPTTTSPSSQRHGPHRVVPKLDGRPRTGGVDDRPSPLDGVRLISLRPHRRTNHLEPRAVRPSAPGTPLRSRGLDRSELGVFLFTAEQYDHPHAALAVLLGLNGLRVSEACATNIEDLGLERGHRTLRIMGKGAKPATIPLVPRTARTIDLAVGERYEGAVLRRRDGQRLDRRTAHRWVRSMGTRAGLEAVHPHMLRAAFIMAALDAGVPLRDVQIAARHADPRTTTIYDRPRQNFDRHAAYVVVAFVAGG